MKKRIISLVLIFIMTLAMVSVFTASATGMPVIQAGDVISVNLTAGNPSIIFSFTPTVSGIHIFESEVRWYSRANVPNAFLYDSSMNLLASDTPTQHGLVFNQRSFRIAYNLIAGNTYYFEATTCNSFEFDEGSVVDGTVGNYTFTVTAPTNPLSGANVNQANSYRIHDNQTIDVELSGGTTSRWYRITPAVSGIYIFEKEVIWYSRENVPNAFLYDSSMNLLASDTPTQPGLVFNQRSFRIAYNLIAGNTYYFEATTCNSFEWSVGTVMSYTFTVTAQIMPLNGANVNSANAYRIHGNQTIDVELAGGAMSRWYRIVPTVSGTYIFEKEARWYSREDVPNAFLYDSSMNLLASDTPTQPGLVSNQRSFRIVYNLIAGNTYYFEATKSNLFDFPVGSIMSYAFTVTAPPGYISPNCELARLLVRSSYRYNHYLARVAARLSEAAYIRNDNDELYQEFRRLGVVGDREKYMYFHNYDYHFWDVHTHTPHGFATRPITINGEEWDLVFVAIRGTNRMIVEHISNANFSPMGPRDEHSGFKTAQEEVFQNLRLFMAIRELDFDSTKFIITGHSRGGAVANLLAAEMNLDSRFNRHNIYTYTFASPRTVANLGAASNPIHGNIFSIANILDSVVGLPTNNLFGLGRNRWTRHGLTMTFDSRGIEFNSRDEAHSMRNTYLPTVLNRVFHPGERAYGEVRAVTIQRFMSSSPFAAFDDNTNPFIVDFEVLNEQGIIVGEVVDGEIAHINEAEIAIFILEDGQISILMFDDTDYTINFTATGDGEITVIAEDVQMSATDPIREKIFENVVLSDGMELVGEITDTPTVRLLVVGGEEIDGEFTEYIPTVELPEIPEILDIYVDEDENIVDVLLIPSQEPNTNLVVGVFDSNGRMLSAATQRIEIETLGSIHVSVNILEEAAKIKVMIWCGTGVMHPLVDFEISERSEFFGWVQIRNT